MLDGLWTIKYSVPNDRGAGVLVLKDGQVLGGDSAFAFVGSYAIDGDKVTAKIHVSKHSEMQKNIFGIDEFDLNLSRKADLNQINLRGSPTVMPKVTATVTGVRKADIR